MLSRISQYRAQHEEKLLGLASRPGVASAQPQVDQMTAFGDNVVRNLPQ